MNLTDLTFTLIADAEHGVRSIIRCGHEDAGYANEGFVRFAIDADPNFEINSGENNDLWIVSPDGLLHVKQGGTEHITIGIGESGPNGHIQLHHLPASEPAFGNALWADENGFVRKSPAPHTTP